KAKALYNFQGLPPIGSKFTNVLPFSKGDVLSIISTAKKIWWVAEVDGLVFAVPTGYLELI
ncbi:hypothetical protein H0H93_014240, partial [Arthromyces matolae]